MKKTIFLVPLIVFLFGCNSKNNETLEGFKIHPEFKLELVAQEPLVFDPVEMRFDENNHAFVLEMPGYPLSDVDSRLVELHDVDADGVFDKRIVLADDLGVATSFMPYKDGFLVAAPPNLLFIKDANRDGEIDFRERLMGGFSNENLQHNFNGLYYGLDNWIYAANGGNSGKPFFIDNPDTIIDIRGVDIKFDIDSKKISKLGRSSGGYKLTFDNWGHMFETHNLTHTSSLVFEDYYLANFSMPSSRTLDNISDHEENGSSRIYPIGEQETRVNHPEQSGYFSGSCGITFYGGGEFPKQFNNNLLVADCVLNLVHLDILSPNGSTFKASRNRAGVEFLASSNRSFRPVNMTVGPDGSLFVIDIHREVIEHPEWIPDELEVEMDLESGKDQGRIYKITPRENWVSKKEKLNVNDVEGLVRALGSANQWIRSMAQQIIVTNKKDQATSSLVEQFKNSENQFARLHSLWSLEGLEKLPSAILRSALNDNASGVRENAIKIAERKMKSDTLIIDELLKLLNDENKRVSLQAALSIGTLNENVYSQYANRIAEAVFKSISNSPNDLWAIYAKATAVQLQSIDFAEKLIVENGRNISENHMQLLKILLEKIAKEQKVEAMVRLLNTMDAEKILIIKITDLVDALSRGYKSGVTKDLNTNNTNNLSIALDKIESKNEMSLLRASGYLRKAVGIPLSGKIRSMLLKSSQLIVDENLSSEKRLEQLKLLNLETFKNREDILFKLINNKNPIVLQEEAMLQLSNSDNTNIGKRLLEMWSELGPKTRKKATDILLYKSYNHDILLTAMENKEVNLGEFNLDLERRRTLLMWSEESIQKRAKKLFSDAGVVNRKDAIDKMRPALKLSGDIARGAAVFANLCAQCHKFGEEGNEVGPVLTEVSRKSKEALLYDILDPNAGVDTKYLNHKIITKDGTILTGLVYLESDSEIGLKMIGGSEQVILKENIKDFSSLGTSMMFEGLEVNMNQQEMADLLSYLQQ